MGNSGVYINLAYREIHRLAEWDLAGGIGGLQTFFDISLIDGYNLPLGVTYITGPNVSLQDIPPNLTNPACVATAGLSLPPATSETPGNASNSSYPIPYQSTQSTGSYNTPKSYMPSLYSTEAKLVYLDAYSYAYDGLSSMFVLPTGGGWEGTFCAPGRSTNILKTFRAQLGVLSRAGHNATELQTDTANLTIIAEGGKENDGEKSKGERIGGASLTALVVVVAVAVLR